MRKFVRLSGQPSQFGSSWMFNVFARLIPSGPQHTLVPQPRQWHPQSTGRRSSRGMWQPRLVTALPSSIRSLSTTACFSCFALVHFRRRRPGSVHSLTTVFLTEQFLSKYGESDALLKDPSWTKDPVKADKGKSFPCSGICCGGPVGSWACTWLAVGRVRCCCLTLACYCLAALLHVPVPQVI